MARFLIWNVKRKPLDGLVQSLVRQLQIDIVMLVEYPLGRSELPGLLKTDGLYRRPSSKRFGVFVRDNHRLSRLGSGPYRLGGRVGFWKWMPPSGTEGLIVLVHGFDRRNYDDSTRRVFFRRVAEGVRHREEARDHRHTLITGDFNAQPYESAIVDSDGLHAIGLQAVQTKTFRTVSGAGAATDFFYNPMWRMFGHSQHPEAGAGTHYWLRAWAHELGWFMLDQVVIRPQESSRFPEHQLRIITEVGAVSLLNAEGLPDSDIASDHLPITFHWDL